MPWRRRQGYHGTHYVAVVANVVLAVCLGILIGYTRWGTTASIVEIVERQLTETQARITSLEKRIGLVENRLGADKAEGAAQPSLPEKSVTRPLRATNPDRSAEKAKP